MANVTEREIMNLKDEAQGIRDNIISAKSTYKEVERNITNHETTLKELGVTDVTKVDEFLEALDSEAAKNRDEAKEIIARYKESTNML